jgi:hypothetical protein
LYILKFYVFSIGTFTESFPSTFPILYCDIHYYETTPCYIFGSLNFPFSHII